MRLVAWRRRRATAGRRAACRRPVSRAGLPSRRAWSRAQVAAVIRHRDCRQDEQRAGPNPLSEFYASIERFCTRSRMLRSRQRRVAGAQVSILGGSRTARERGGTSGNAAFVLGTSPLFAALGYAARRAATAWRGPPRRGHRAGRGWPRRVHPQRGSIRGCPDRGTLSGDARVGICCDRPTPRSATARP